MVTSITPTCPPGARCLVTCLTSPTVTCHVSPTYPPLPPIPLITPPLSIKNLNTPPPGSIKWQRLSSTPDTQSIKVTSKTPRAVFLPPLPKLPTHTDNMTLKTNNFQHRTAQLHTVSGHLIICMPLTVFKPLHLFLLHVCLKFSVTLWQQLQK